MRRAIILALLLGGMQLVLPLGVRGVPSQTLLTFGFLILAAYTAGEIATTARQPRLVGYLVAGITFGPSALDIVTAEAARALAPITGLAIALIAFLAGAELRWSEVRGRFRAILVVLGTELGIGFVAIAALLVLMSGAVPFLQGLSTREVVTFSVLFAAMAIVHSPAVTLAMLSETGARGPVARTTLGVVLLSDVAVVVLFSAVLSIAQVTAPPRLSAGAPLAPATIAWELAGAIVVGAVIGAAVAAYLKFVRHELFLFAIFVALLGAEIARLSHVEVLLTLLTAGFVAENVSTPEVGASLRHAMERSAAPVFVVFFALAGAAIDVRGVLQLWPVIVPLVGVRIAAIWAGTTVAARWTGLSTAEQKYVWTGLVSQAGVAIGFATVVAHVYPTRGALLQTLFLAVLAVNQLVGPILFRRGLAKSGELEPDGRDSSADAAAVEPLHATR